MIVFTKPPKPGERLSKRDAGYVGKGPFWCNHCQWFKSGSCPVTGTQVQPRGCCDYWNDPDAPKGIGVRKAEYVYVPGSNYTCSECKFFDTKSNTCTPVVGHISPGASCNKWMPEEKKMTESLIENLRESIMEGIREGSASASSDGTERGAPAASGKFPPSLTYEDGGQTRTPPLVQAPGATAEMRGAPQSQGRPNFSTGGPAPRDFPNTVTMPRPSEHVSDGHLTPHRTDGDDHVSTPSGTGDNTLTIDLNPPMLDGYEDKVKEAAAASTHAHSHAHMHSGGDSHLHPHVHHHDHHHTDHAREAVARLKASATAEHVHSHDHMHANGLVHTHDHAHMHHHQHGDGRMHETQTTGLGKGKADLPGVVMLREANVSYPGTLCATCSHPKGHHVVESDKGLGMCIHCGPKGSTHKFTEVVDFSPQVMTVPLARANPPDPGDVTIALDREIKPAGFKKPSSSFRESKTFIGNVREAHLRMFSEEEQAMIRLEWLHEAIYPARTNYTELEGPGVRSEQGEAARSRADVYNAHTIAAHRQTLQAFMSGDSAHHTVAAQHHTLAAEAATKASADYPKEHQAHKDYTTAANYHSKQSTAHTAAASMKGAMPRRYELGLNTY